MNPCGCHDTSPVHGRDGCHGTPPATVSGIGLDSLTAAYVIEDAIALLEAAPAYMWAPGEPDETVAALRVLASKLSQSSTAE